jgi:putative ABC transport system permease protein
MLPRVALRSAARHPWQLALAVVGVGLGVAVVTAIDLASSGARRAFELAAEAVAGRATHQIAAGPGGMDEALYRRLAATPGLGTAAPVVEGYALVKEPGRRGSRALRVLGLDPFSEAPFRPFFSGLQPARESDDPDHGGLETSTPPLAALLTRPGTVLLARSTAAELGLRSGERFRVAAGAQWRQVELLGLLTPRDDSARIAASDLLLADIATAQELLGKVGRLDRIDLILPAAPGGASAEERVRGLLPPGADLLPAGQGRAAMADLTRSFRLNLTALSLLALVCGLFLIYNTVTFSVVRRRTLIATLRALGCTRREIFALILGEALGLGLLGTAAGLAGGIALGRTAIALVTRTIDDLYFVASVRDVGVAPEVLLRAGLLGLAATLLAALAPAFEAARAEPALALARSPLERGVRRTLPRAAALGAALLLLGGAGLAFPGAGLPATLGAISLAVVGYSCLAPAALAYTASALRRPLGLLAGPLGRLAAAGISATLSRTAVAAAALTVAIAVSVGVGIMIASFRATVVRWLEHTLQADVYASVPGRAGGFSGGDLDPALVARVAALPGVERLNLIRRVEVMSPRGPVRLLAVGSDRRGLDAFELAQGDPRRVWPAFQGGDGVVLSEPFHRRTGVRIGDRMLLRTAQGEVPFAVLGVYYDYASDRGLVLMSRSTYLRHWRDPALSGFSLRLVPGGGEAAAEKTAAELRRRLGPDLALSVQPTGALKRASLAVFDRTFRVTAMLRGIAILVAFVGVLASLLAIQLERTRELGVLRATGLTAREVWSLVTLQSVLLGGIAGLLALPLGVGLGAAMTTLLNRRSFGWTLRLEVAPSILLQALAFAVAAALLASLYPAWRMARTEPAAALRND